VFEMLGIRMTAFLGDNGGDRETGWDEAERAALQATIAARQPFLDFAFSRVNPDGSKQHYRVSGEPMFNPACGFTGYRGIGVEVTSKA
jgi:hypothetical protein